MAYGYGQFRNSQGKRFFNPDKQIWENGDGELTFHKEVYTEKHFMRILNSWGMARETLKALRDMGVNNIEIKCMDDGKTYCTTLQKFLKDGQIGNFGKAGKQWFLAITPKNYTIIDRTE